MYIILFILTIIILFIVLLIIIWHNQNLIFLPLNILYHTDSSPRTNFYSNSDKITIFPASIKLESLWKIIRSEGHNLYNSLPIKNINYLDNYNIDIGNETKEHWTTIPLRLFGYDNIQYISQCPQLSTILQSHPEIKSCIFSIMDPGKIIQPHYGPYDGLLRYQLALDIPPVTSDQECYLHVNNEKYYWKEGDGILFDESNLHGAVNTTPFSRMVLLIDLERPYNFPPFRFLNKLIITLMGVFSL